METIKALHILGVSLFIGNIIISAFWKVMADRSRNLSVMQFGVKLVNLTDMLFTGLGSTLLIVTGHIMAKEFGGIASQEWIITSYILFAVSGILWLVALAPIQLKQSNLIKDLPIDAPIPKHYYKLGRAWSLIGTIAIIIPLPAIFLMVSKTV